MFMSPSKNIALLVLHTSRLSLDVGLLDVDDCLFLGFVGCYLYKDEISILRWGLISLENNVLELLTMFLRGAMMSMAK